MHTPGPYTISGNAPLIVSRAAEEDTKVVARIIVETDGFLHEEDYRIRNGNAALLAAAPDMLEALQEAIKWIEEITDALNAGGGYAFADKLKTVARKANGEVE